MHRRVNSVKVPPSLEGRKKKKQKKNLEHCIIIINNFYFLQWGDRTNFLDCTPCVIPRAYTTLPCKVIFLEVSVNINDKQFLTTEDKL